MLLDTGLEKSLGGEMPVYEIKGVEGPALWRDRVDNGYGWQLCKPVIDESLIALGSLDDKWVIGTAALPGYKTSFNTKGVNVHGCIHSEPFFLNVQPGETRTAKVRTFMFKGTPEELIEKYLKFKEDDRKLLPD
jgi:hypothetical protein